jgi:pyruvate kinase
MPTEAERSVERITAAADDVYRLALGHIKAENHAASLRDIRAAALAILAECGQIGERMRSKDGVPRCSE